MSSENRLWYESIPTFLNQEPRTLDSFNSNEKFEDDKFVPCVNSLIDPSVYKRIVDNYISEPNNKLYQDDKEDADLLNSITVWMRISDLYPDYDLFPSELHCDSFEQGSIGDCYFVDMISLISNYGELLTRLFPIKKNKHGYYEVILFINGWKRVIIDDYIPIITQNDFKPLTCLSKKYGNCFYNILIEKAWAKVNKNYYNIIGGGSHNSLLVLTGYQGKKIYFNNNITDARKNEILEDMKDGINRHGHLYGVNTKGHAYSLLKLETICVNNNNYQVLQIRNPWGSIGEKHFLKGNQNLMTLFQGKKAIVEDELMPKFEQFNRSPDTGIFYISKNYFFQLFESYSKCYHMFNSSITEFLLKFTLTNLNRKYFMFKLQVENENSLVQINLTKHFFNSDGKMKFNYYQPEIKMKPFVSDEINKKIPPGVYFIEWHYNFIGAPEEILFWICYQGNVKLDFLGISNISQMNYNYFNFISNEGLILQKNSYKLSEKLGETYQRKAKMYDFIKNVLHLDINQEEEDRGYTVSYQENENVSFTFIVDREDSTRVRFLSQNLDFPEYIFEGGASRRSRILGEGNIYSGNNLVYHGQINYNLFPQSVQENNNNRLIIDVVAKRFKLSQELNEEEFLNLNVRRSGPFEGQIMKSTHSHALTKCITPNRRGWICDHCNKHFDNRRYSFYCSECDFDFCSENCSNPNQKCREREPHYDEAFQFKSLQHKDPLVKMKILGRNQHFKCFSCLKNIPLENTIYYCTRCDFRLCQDCQINETKGEKWQFHSSWHEHPLTFCKTKGYQKNEERKTNKDKVEILEDSDYFFTCNHCGVEYSRKKDSFYCTACDFYICMKCYKNYFFFNDREVENAINIRMGNREVYPIYCRCFLNDENIKTVNCKKCNVELNLSDWTYYCSNCNSNFCNNCHLFHKVIFENDILIFDGFFENNIKNGFGITYKNNNKINFSGNWENGLFKLMKDIPHSHPMIRNNFNEDTQCDICYNLCDPFDTGISCNQCNLDICDNCIIKINRKILEFPNCVIKIIRFTDDNYHKCDYCKEQKRYTFFTLRRINERTIYYRCRHCFLKSFHKNK